MEALEMFYLAIALLEMFYLAIALFYFFRIVCSFLVPFERPSLYFQETSALFKACLVRNQHSNKGRELLEGGRSIQTLQNKPFHSASGMGTTIHSRGGGRGRHQSLFYRDLTVAPSMRSMSFTGQSNTPGQSPPAASLWRENAGGTEPPPPPFYTLEDRIERTPEASTGDAFYRSPDSRYSEGKSPLRTPKSVVNGKGPVLGYGDTPVISPQTPYVQTSASPSWWSPRERSLSDLGRRDGEREGGGPVSGVVHQQPSGGLLTLPPPREIIRPEIQRIAPAGEEGDEWVTVFGFVGEDTNAVLREFEKCGPIVRHVPGPGGANWVHIQYQNRQDAQKALQKNGIQLYGALIVGVKPVDPLQRQALSDKVQRSAGFMVAPPRSPLKGTSSVSVHASSRPYYLQPSDGARKTTAIIASPSKSTFSKIIDLIFGF